MHRSMSCIRNCLLRNNITIRQDSYSNSSYYTEYQDLEEIKTIIFELYEKGLSIKKMQNLVHKDHNRISFFLKNYGYKVDNHKNLKKRIILADNS
jgi:transposase-like protein